jgi:SAM-dependent methyltransferase
MSELTDLQQDARQYAPATQRNREVILEVLSQVLPPTGTVLEISSGTGEHAVFLAPRLQPRQWIPSDPNPIAIASIRSWREHCPTDNLCEPIALDASKPIWSIEQYSKVDLSQDPIAAVVNINMIHIAPWDACLGLMAGAGRILSPGGILYLYGPFKRGGVHTAPSNAEFDLSLQQQNPAWGVRDLDDVVAIAESQNFKHIKTYAMPANNLSVVFQARRYAS